MCQQQVCPLCLNNHHGAHFFQDDRRDYLQCQDCQLIFALPEYFLSADEEKARYDTHQNSPKDPRYRQFLNRLFLPIQQQLSPHSSGLDFGSGPGPTLSVMFEEVGHQMAIYDRFYADDPTVFDSRYDFITTSETIEHLQQPRQAFDLLWRCLKPGGLLGVMTQFVEDPADFNNWHYKNDLTHVCFYSESTFRWVAALWLTEPNFIETSVVLFRKPTKNITD